MIITGNMRVDVYVIGSKFCIDIYLCTVFRDSTFFLGHLVVFSLVSTREDRI